MCWVTAVFPKSGSTWGSTTSTSTKEVHVVVLVLSLPQEIGPGSARPCSSCLRSYRTLSSCDFTGCFRSLTSSDISSRARIRQFHCEYTYDRIQLHAAKHSRTYIHTRSYICPVRSAYILLVVHGARECRRLCLEYSIRHLL